MSPIKGLGDLPRFDMDEIPGKMEILQEEQDEKDYQYITKMYSTLSREILEFIEDACDRLEYEGSMMFDQYMDRVGVMSMVDKIYDKVKYHEKEDGPKKDRMLYQMILALLGGEMCHRRCRYRMKKRMFS